MRWLRGRKLLHTLSRRLCAHRPERSSHPPSRVFLCVSSGLDDQPCGGSGRDIGIRTQSLSVSSSHASELHHVSIRWPLGSVVATESRRFGVSCFTLSYPAIRSWHRWYCPIVARLSTTSSAFEVYASERWWEWRESNPQRFTRKSRFTVSCRQPISCITPIALQEGPRCPMKSRLLLCFIRPI